MLTLRLLAILAATAMPLCAAGRANIIFIVADDLGYGELGCYGGRDVPTPNIDSLAGNGVRFTDAYVTAPVCAPSRAGLLTGRYQARFGFESNPIGAQNADPSAGLPPGERTLADVLRDQGCATASIGKWHLGGTAKFHPQRRGFDEFFGFLHEGHYYAPPPWIGVTTWLRRKALPDGSQGRWISPDGRMVWTTHMGSFEPEYDTDNPLLRESQPVDEKENLTDAFTREAESFIARHKSQPFFLYLAYNAVHSPMQGADRYMEKSAHIPDIHRRIFTAMLAHLDDSVGRVLARIRSEGLEERTLIVFLSDNGGPTRELTSSNGPLRGEKGQLLEGGIRVPMLIQWKGHVPAGRVETAPVSSLDLFPTALAAAGCIDDRNAPVATARDGVNLLPLIEDGAGLPPRALFFRYGAQFAVRSGDWKLVKGGKEKEAILVNLTDDIAEQRDLSASQPGKRSELNALYEAWNSKIAGPVRPLSK
jgi:arylsulfatase A-like enzyme